MGGAQERTRTSTPVKALVPETSASTNSATWAGLRRGWRAAADELEAGASLVNQLPGRVTSFVRRPGSRQGAKSGFTAACGGAIARPRVANGWRAQ